MNPQAEKQNQTLENIKNQLVKIRDSEALQNVEEDSDIAKGLEGVFGATGNVFSDLQVENGVLTSRSAQQAVDNADKNIRSQKGGGGGQDPMAALREQNQKLQEAFEREKSTREGLEADKSIADQRAEDTANEAAAKAASASSSGSKSDKSTTPSTEGEQTAPEEGEEVQDAFSGIESDDPVVNAQIQNAREQNQLINQQLDALDNFVEASEEDTKAMVESLRNTADRQIKRAEKENARLAQAAQVSGIVSGRGMYSPEEHEGIISETIQEGLDRIGDIENTRNTAIMEAKKAQREFRYEAFVQMSDMVSALSDMKRQTIVDVNTRLNEIEKQEREKMQFDQEQAERNAFILAPELTDATPEEIARVAAANGIEPGLLQREVQTYADENRLTELDIENQEALLTGRKLDNQIANMEINAALSGGGDGGEVGGEPMDAATRKFWETELGGDGDPIAIPTGLSEEAVVALREENPGVTGKAMQDIITAAYTSAATRVQGAVGELSLSRARGAYQAGSSANVALDNLAEKMGLESGNELFNNDSFKVTLGEQVQAAKANFPDASLGELPMDIILTKAVEAHNQTLRTSGTLRQPEELLTNLEEGSQQPAETFDADLNDLNLDDPLGLSEMGLDGKDKFKLSPEAKRKLERELGL